MYKLSKRYGRLCKAYMIIMLLIMVILVCYFNEYYYSLHYTTSIATDKSFSLIKPKEIINSKKRKLIKVYFDDTSYYDGKRMNLQVYLKTPNINERFFDFRPQI